MTENATKKLEVVKKVTDQLRASNAPDTTPPGKAVNE